MLFTTAFNNVGAWLTHFDLAPNFSGFLIGFTKTMGNIPLLLGRMFMTSVLMIDMQEKDWCLYYFFAGVSLLVGNFMYIVLANDELQKFNKIISLDSGDDSTTKLTSTN
ncbi:uncharacterized protein LOC112127095 [Cimex lectularius]|uniref:Uncharacterized protein n=1 Tax=Cimex lectularius TaxID=79782 RepID=A0A8I6SIQ2_CIMLE|nr:uncharacterized protein LOC112127095 [Cimex lectularius]